MSGVVGAEAREGLHRPALAVAQQVGRHAEQRLDHRGTLVVAAEVDVGAQHLRGFRRALPDRGGQVHEAHMRSVSGPETAWTDVLGRWSDGLPIPSPTAEEKRLQSPSYGGNV